MEEDKISIVYLDDEEHNLSAFRASFRRSHDVRVASTAEEAHQLLDEREPHIIIADQRMPGTTGVEFFEEVVKTHPEPIRILLTAYTSSQTVIDAVNRGHIDRYLVKPWDRNLMETTLQAGFEAYQTKQELKLKNEELRRVNSELNRFVYSVSHDLRAPLLSILGLIDLSKEETDPEELKQYFTLMETSAKRMDRYIQTTLEYYRNFKTEIHLEKVDLGGLVKEIVESIKSYSKFASFNLIGDTDSGINTDKVRAKIALSNLISNAVKYGFKNPSEPYTIEIEMKNKELGMSIVIRDHGNGIPSGELKNIFQMFYQGSSQHDRARSMGLGLFLVRESIEKIKGDIRVRSKEGIGTEFELFIPNLSATSEVKPV